MSSEPSLMESTVQAVDADALYAKGMTHYRRREWQEARECFARLRATAPERRGVGALLKEVDLFIQLEAMQPRQREAVLEPPEPPKAEESTAPVRPRPTPGRSARRSPWASVVLLLTLLMLVVVVLYATGMLDDLVGSQRQARVAVLVNQGRAAMNVGDYDRSVLVFGEALALAPSDDEIKTWYAKAQRFQQLASLYEQAEADIAAEQWAVALEKLQKIASMDPTYSDVGKKISLAQTQQLLQAQLRDAQALIQDGQYAGAIRSLEQLREGSPTFHSTEVKQALFTAYFRQGVQLMSGAGDSLDTIGQAIRSFDQAIVLSPEDTTALEERRLADLYRQGYLSYTQSNWPQATVVLQQIYGTRAEYAEGRVASMLCTSYLRLGDAYYAAGDLLQSLQQYKNVLAMGACDHVEAAVREREINAILYPPTATPTVTPTRTPLPTQTRTPTPTPTWAPTSTPYPVQTTRPRPTSPPATAAPPTPKPR
jgi:tetratricopeptide (TPR) repeat protein